MIFGVRHLMHGGGSAVGRYERKGYPNATFVVMGHNGFGKDKESLEQRMSDWMVPSLASTRESWLGDLDLSAVLPDAQGGKLSSRVDGYLYLGPRDLLLNEPIPANVMLDKGYMAELQRRAAIMGGPPRGDQVMQEATGAGVFFYQPPRPGHE